MNPLKIDIQHFLSKDEIERMARETGFVERKSPITGTAFLLAMMAGAQGSAEGTLAEQTTFLCAAFGLTVSPQALDARFSAAATAFLESCLCKALAILKKAPHRVKALSRFKHVYAIDSTNFTLAPELVAVFKGSGGGGSKSAMRIQFVLDFCTGAMYLEVGDVTLCDPAALASVVRDAKVPLDGECLFLSDLGYFKSSTFADICSKPGISFLSKMFFGMNIHKVDGSALDLDQKLKSNPSWFEEMITVGGATCRMVAMRLDDSTAGQRIRRGNSNSDSKSGRISAQYRRFLHYAIFVTNLPPDYTMEKLFVLYRIRWQVELVFKSWKSILGIDRQRSAKKARVRCEVYGRLIVATVVALLESITMMATAGIVISRYKAAKVVKTCAGLLATGVANGEIALRNVVEMIVITIGRLCRKAKCKKKPTIEQRLNASLGEYFVPELPK